MTPNKIQGKFTAISQVKLTFAIVALGALAFVILSGFYYWREIFHPENTLRNSGVKKNESTLLVTDKKVPDLGKIRYEQARKLIAESDWKAAREKLYEILQYYPKSEAISEVKKTLGDINIDRLFSQENFEDKSYYTVRRGDSLSLIIRRLARREEAIIMTPSFLVAVNRLFDYNINPGQNLIVFPLKFSGIIDYSSMTFTLFRKNKFFKSYDIVDGKPPKRLKLPGTISISHRNLTLNKRNISPYDSRAEKARKWLLDNSVAFVIAATRENEDDFSIPTQFGAFFSKADFNEIFMLLPRKTKLKVKR